MKKIFKFIVILALIGIILMCLARKLDILDFSDYREIPTEDIQKYSNYYFNRLSEIEKRIYIKISKSIENNKTNINFSNVDEENINQSIGKALTAYINDNPDVFYISNSYSVITKELFGIKLYTLKIEYDYTGDINQGKYDLNNAINDFLKGITTSKMTDYEKEIAIHDKLVKTVKYYDYKDIENIPNIKHSSYGALVEKEAVCDGYSKALKILLDKVGIENIVITGKLDGVAHAWNIVKIENNYYHVDTTSDDGIDKASDKYVIHAYFNVTDNEINKTHEINQEFELPKCNSNKYNYYTYNGYILKSYDSISSKLKTIVKSSQDSSVLEINTDGNTSLQRIIDTLYDLNFNMWQTKRVTNITYNKINDIYIFKK